MVDALMRLANDIKTNKCSSVENVFPTDLCQDVSSLKHHKTDLINQMNLLNKQRSQFKSFQSISHTKDQKVIRFSKTVEKSLTKIADLFTNKP